MFIDESIIFLKSGDGGDGAATFRREKFVQFGGPNGGDGGKGGDIVFETDPNINTLVDFKYSKKFVASNGENGRKNRAAGKSGDDLIIKVPVGTMIRDVETNKLLLDLNEENMRAVFLRGGDGGRGFVVVKKLRTLHNLNKFVERNPGGRIGGKCALEGARQLGGKPRQVYLPGQHAIRDGDRSIRTKRRIPRGGVCENGRQRPPVRLHRRLRPAQNLRIGVARTLGDGSLLSDSGIVTELCNPEIDEHRLAGHDVEHLAHDGLQLVFAVNDEHAATAEDERRAEEYRVGELAGIGDGFSGRA